MARAYLTSVAVDRLFVDEGYLTLLGRPADLAGEQGWLDLMQAQRLSQSALAEGLLASDEFFIAKRR
jgi:hypothetical protein